MTYFGLLIGAVLGAAWAWKKDGKLLDILHYATILAIVCGLIAMVLNVIILRMG
ncbi:MAG: hypothetical protein ACPGRD_08500 [Planktomarina sp.]